VFVCIKAHEPASKWSNRRALSVVSNVVVSIRIKRVRREAAISRAIPLTFELYFAGRSNTGPRKEKDREVPGGIAFIRENSEQGSTLGRMYLITEEEFNDVVMQENGKTPDGSRFVPAFNQLVSQSQSILPGNPLYGKLLNIGSAGGCPILTFTTARIDLFNPNAPAEQYVKVVASGIKETYPQMSDDDIVAYL